MFKQLLVLSLTVCLIGCSGKDKSEKTGQQSNQLSQKVRPGFCHSSGDLYLLATAGQLVGASRAR